MPELMPINIVIGDRTYRIKIDPQHEENVRKTIKSVNDKILEFKMQFSGKDMQDFVAMALIWIATNQSPTQSPLSDNLSQQLSTIEDLLNRALSENDNRSSTS